MHWKCLGWSSQILKIIIFMMEISFNQVSAAILLWNLTIQTLTSAQFLYCRSFSKAKNFELFDLCALKLKFLTSYFYYFCHILTLLIGFNKKRFSFHKPFYLTNILNITKWINWYYFYSSFYYFQIPDMNQI